MKVTEEGVLFRSYRNGDEVMLTPESTIECQKAFGSDIIIPLDELPAQDTNTFQLRNSLERTHRWEARSLAAHQKDFRGQAIFSVIHGGMLRELRQQSINFLGSLSFDGHAIGGSLGRNRQEMISLLEWLVPMMKLKIDEKPIHLLGIGDLDSIEHCIPLGIDSFDSTYPARAGRHGTLFTSNGILKLKETANVDRHFQSIEPDCRCYTCSNYSVSYLHHLLKCNELTYQILGTIHNLHFVIRRMSDIRELILNDQL